MPRQCGEQEVQRELLPALPVTTNLLHVFATSMVAGPMGPMPEVVLKGEVIHRWLVVPNCI
jgi:hypothetical protein